MAKSLRDTIFEQLSAEIASGGLPPGSYLNEKTIGERFKISRTPAREVLLQLSSAGFVNFVPRRGAVVLSMPTQEVVSMIEVLVAIEGEAAALATRRMEATERRQMAENYAHAIGAVEEITTAEYSKANILFHDAIYAGCRNRILVGEIKKYRLKLVPYLHHNFVSRGRLRSSHAEHAAILSAIQSGDERGAEAAMRHHILNGGNLLADVLAKIQAT
ncbi:MAG: GntR family transcriptional regulator [Reyranellaceae bacterium]